MCSLRPASSASAVGKDSLALAAAVTPVWLTVELHGEPPRSWAGLKRRGGAGLEAGPNARAARLRRGLEKAPPGLGDLPDSSAGCKILPDFNVLSSHDPTF